MIDDPTGLAIALVVMLGLALFGATLAPAGWRRVAGEWRDGSDAVTFDGMGYRCHGVCTGLGPSGRWQRVGRYGVMVQWADGHQVMWRVVGYKGGLRLALLPPDGDDVGAGRGAAVLHEGAVTHTRVDAWPS